MASEISDGARHSTRKLAAKRFNERIKLFAASINAIGLGIFATATVLPNFSPTPVDAQSGVKINFPWWIGPVTFVVLFIIAQAAYQLMRSED